MTQRADLLAQADGLLELGDGHYDAERWPEALRCFQVCSDIYAQIGERAKEAQSHSNLGFTHRSLQQPSLAAEAFRRAVDLFRKVGDHAEEGNAQGNLGLALSDQGLYELAIEHFEEAERIHRSLSDLGVVAYSLSNSALAHFNLRKVDDTKAAVAHLLMAHKLWGSALTMYGYLHDTKNECMVLEHDAAYFEEIREYSNAESELSQALEICKQTGDRVGEARILHRLGNVMSRWAVSSDFPGARIGVAVRYYLESLDIFEDCHDAEDTAAVAFDLARAYFQRREGKSASDLARALECCAKALHIYEASGNLQAAHDVRAFKAWLARLVDSP
jgi:tetratricopeptide (TPR) repeat protein